MDINGKQPFSLTGSFTGATLTLFLLTVFFLVATPATGSAQNTAFLPLKINSPADHEILTEETDQLLSTVLSDREIIMIPRFQAQTLVDYSGSWPPSLNALKQLANTAGYNNIAVGSLTQIGKQLSLDIKVFDLLAPTKPQYFYRNVPSVDTLSDAIEAIVLDILAYTGREFRIASIAPEGNVLIDSGAILRKIKSRAGDAYNPTTLREDLKSIFAMGYFNDVQIQVTDSAEGKDVVFKVVEKPIIASVIFTGIEDLDEEDVEGAANIREHHVLNPTRVSAGVEGIKELYKSEGYYNTTVTSKISFPSEKGAVVEYTINEGKKIFIKEISIEGNTTFDDDELLDEIDTAEKGLFSWLTSSGLLEMDVIRQDAKKIVAFYHNHGFLEAKIGEPEVRQEEEWLYLTFFVEEGPRFKVGTVSVDGDIIGNKEDILELISLRDETYISRAIVREDILAIVDHYAEQGHAFANVTPDFYKSESGERLDINFQIDKGELVYVNRIIISGNNRTRENVIRRELRIYEGGVFNSKALRDSSKALQRLQYFESVNVTPEPTIDPARMNIKIEVVERSTGTFSIGAGYSSVDDVIIMGSISENNFLGRGDQLKFDASIGGSSQLYDISYTDPHVNDSPLTWGIDLFSTEREYDDYTRDAIGGAVRLGYPVWEKWVLIGTYSYTDSDLSDIADDASIIIKRSAELPITSAVQLSAIRDTRDKRFGATEGSRNLLSVKYGGGPFGGDSQFTKVEGATSWYFPLFWKTTFHFKAAAGQVFENEDGKLPVYERFFLGGMNTVRGFDYAKISPIDAASGERIGGNKMWYTNFEVIFPLVEEYGIDGLTFFDAGQVLNNNEDWSFDNYKKSAGLGIRWLSPMGPLSLVWGFNLDPQDDEDESVFDFSIGGTF